MECKNCDNLRGHLKLAAKEEKERMSRIRKQVEAWRDEAEGKRVNALQVAREGYEGAIRHYNKVLDLLDGES